MSGAITGARIKRLRNRLGLSQVELAALLGISNVTVNRWEHDRAQPQPGTIERLVRMEAEGVAALAVPPSPRRDNLPRLLTPLIGRGAEQAALASRVSERPLVTTTGTAGAGKTRLAVEVGRAMRPTWPDGVWFVDLAAVHDPDAVAQAVAHVLGIRESGKLPLLDRLRDAFAERALLLILDNCEHLQGACASLADRLLEAAGASHLLATGRVPLGLAGEAIFPLRPLAEADAAALFVQRARELQPDLTLDAAQSAAIAEICQRLDGLPLAIELAAARTSVLTVEQIAGRLDQRFELLRSGVAGVPRQRALDTAIAWSCELLTGEEAALFRRLGIFAGWFDLPAVEAIGGQDQPIELLDRLAHQSMLVVERDPVSRSARYRLLESLAAYARQWLAQRGDTEEVARRHAGYYGGLMESLADGLRGPNQVALLTVVDREQANIFAALEWMVAAGEMAQATRLAAALGPYWSLRGRYAEGIGWLERVLAQPPGASDEPRALALIELGLLQYLASRFAEAKRVLGEATALARAHGQRWQEARALDTLGLVLAARRELDAAWRAHEAALEIAMETGDRVRAATCTLNLGRLTNLRGDNAGADRLFHQAWALIQGTGDPATEALILSHLGEVAARMGRFGRALDYYQRTLERFRAVGDPDRSAVVATNTAEVQLALGDVVAALPLASRAVTQFRAIGNPQHLAGATYIEGAALAAAGRLVEALELFRESLALYHQLDDWIDIVYCVEAVARVFAEAGDAALAARLLGGGEAIRERDAIADYPLFDYAGVVNATRVALGDAAMEECWAEGRQMTPEAVVAEALHVGTVVDGKPIDILVRQRQAPAPDGREVALTARQAEVLRLVAAGLSNRDIGEALSISDRTVERHLTAIFGALDVDRRSAAVAKATSLGLI